MRENYPIGQESRANKFSPGDQGTGSYASDPRKYKDPLLPKFKVISYSKNDYLVVDRYTGHRKYTGQAVTYYKNHPVFALNYYGAVTKSGMNTDSIFQFLKEALRAATGMNQHRGLDGFRRGEYTYKNKYVTRNGMVEGREEILFGRTVVYAALYHGGSVEDRRKTRSWSRGIASATSLFRGNGFHKRSSG